MKKHDYIDNKINLVIDKIIDKKLIQAASSLQFWGKRRQQAKYIILMQVLFHRSSLQF